MFHNTANFGRPTARIPGITDQALTPGQQAVQAILAKAHELSLGLAQPESLLVQQTPLPRNDGYWQHFERGWVYWSPRTGAHMVTGAIFAKWASLGWEQGFLGFPTSDETTIPDQIGRFNHFEHGSIFQHQQAPPREVHGAIWEKWRELGAERSPLGFPTGDETGTPDRIARCSNFQNGTIYWTPQTGAHPVRRGTLLGTVWMDKLSVLGYPTSDETQTADNRGHYMNCLRGAVYIHGYRVPHAIDGDFFALWASLGREQSTLGYPSTDRERLPERTGTYQGFDHGYIIGDEGGVYTVMGEGIPDQVYGPAPGGSTGSGGSPTSSQPAASEAQVGVRRIDFEGVRSNSPPALPYEAGPPERIDFEGSQVVSPAPPPYEAGPPTRIDFEGTFGHS
jgi:uncharacterized protein with LGFP repeats